MQTKQSKFPIGWVIAIFIPSVVILLFSILNVCLEGITVKGIIGILTPFISLLFLYMAMYEKKEMMTINFKKAAILELLFLVLLICTELVGTIAGTNHYFNVWINKKTEIFTTAEEQVKQLENMYSNYNAYTTERIKDYDNWLSELEKNPNSQKAKNTFKDGANRERLKTALENAITCKDDQNENERLASNWLEQIKIGGPILQKKRVQQISEHLNRICNQLNNKANSYDKDNPAYFWTYPLDVNDKIMQLFETTEGEKPNTFAILLALICCAIMLIPYISIQRDGRSKGLIYEILSNRQEQEGGLKI